MALTDKLTAIANAIREKTGGTEPLTLDQMPTEIVGIETGGGGGGGSVETCTVQFSYIDYLYDTPGVLYYTKPDLTSGQATYQASRDNPFQPMSSVTVLKNSIVVLTSPVPPEEFGGNLSGDCEPLIESFIGGWAFRVNGDCFVDGTNG